MMFLYATDADMRAAEAERGERYEAAYMPEDMQLEPEQIYLAKTEETQIGISTASLMRRAKAIRCCIPCKKRNPDAKSGLLFYLRYFFFVG